MNFDAALDAFDASLKTRKAAEIVYLGASDPDHSAAAKRIWIEAIEASRACGLRLLAAPVRNPADLVVKARALKWHCPDSVRIERPVEFGGAHPPAGDAPFEIMALHYLTRDLFQLAG